MDAPIIDRIQLPGGRGTVILYDWTAEEVCDGRNLVLTDPNGVEIWRAEPPNSAGGDDCFIKIEWDGERLSAFAWSCARVAIDLSSGAIVLLDAPQ